jgi:hypothetical protein
MLLNQSTELKSSIKQNQLKQSHRHRLNEFANINRKVSQYALDKILEQYTYATREDDNTLCTGHFTNIFGLPCKHYIRECISTGSSIPLEEVHSQWRVDIEVGMKLESNHFENDEQRQIRPRKWLFHNLGDLLYNDDNIAGSLMARLKSVASTPFDTLLEAEKVIKKRGRPVGAKNIRRDKSAFEYVEGRKCGKCNQAGHNIRTCTANDDS